MPSYHGWYISHKTAQKASQELPLPNSCTESFYETPLPGRLEQMDNKLTKIITSPVFIQFYKIGFNL
uniref:Uncharacterized protein n=1 Tax=Arundo donax TaxID=35708 RepID=A0A0A9D5E7_ARUDO